MSGRAGTIGDLLGDLSPRSDSERLAEGAVLLHGFARGEVGELVAAAMAVAAHAPFRRMMTPGGYEMSVEMTNCGAAGWVTDRSGYRYDAIDPATRLPWPAMPPLFLGLAARAATAAGFPGF